MDRKRYRIAVAWLLIVVTATVLLGQVLPVVVDQPFAGDRNVTGQGVPGSAPLTVYDSSNGRNYLGSGQSIDQQGYFAVAVNPPLTGGQKIVVVDSQGHSSAETIVTVKTGPTGQGN
jgi:hypothetical protein